MELVWGVNQAAAQVAGSCSLTCPDTITQGVDPGQCGAQVEYPLPTLSGDCVGVVIACNPSPGFFAVGTTPVQCVAKDSAGNEIDGCSFDVIVLNNVNPQISYPSEVKVCAGSGGKAAKAEFGVQAADGCGAVTVVCQPPSGSDFEIGSTTVKCEVTAGSGEKILVSFPVIVRDCSALEIACPESLTVCAEDGKCTRVINYSLPVSPSATVECTPPPGAAFPIGTTTVSCTATDPAGRQAGCSFTVTVKDCQSPNLECPQNIVRCRTSAQESVIVTYQPKATDNCSEATVVCNPVSGSPFPLGQTPVVCTATDAAGNQSTCQFTVTVSECSGPQITCPENIAECAEDGTCARVINYSLPVSPSATVECTPPPGTAFPIGTTTVSCVATHPSGQSASCSFAVTVVDCQPPKIECPQPIIKFLDGGKEKVAVEYQVSGLDPCGTVEVVCDHPSGSEFPVGVTTVTCKATDLSGHQSTCGFTVTVIPCRPTEARKFVATPEVLWPPNHKMVPVTLSLAEGSCGALPCHIVSVTSSESGKKGSSRGSAAAQWNITGDLTVELQAERAGNGSGRTYTIVVECVDASGHRSTSSVTVPVAHDHRRLVHSRNGHTLSLSWDPDDADSILESTDSLERPNWKPVPTGPKNEITVPAEGGRRFYRLRQ